MIIDQKRQIVQPPSNRAILILIQKYVFFLIPAYWRAFVTRAPFPPNFYLCPKEAL